MKLKAAAVLLNNDLPAYTLLSFAAPAERARFILQPEMREKIIKGVRWAGYVGVSQCRNRSAISTIFLSSFLVSAISTFRPRDHLLSSDPR